LGSYQFQISYAGGTSGQDVVLTCVFAPNVWTGSVSNLWSNAANWSNGVPQAGSTLTFPSTFVNTQQINDLGVGNCLHLDRVQPASFIASGAMRSG
jgi:hypothetical protein